MKVFLLIYIMTRNLVTLGRKVTITLLHTQPVLQIEVASTYSKKELRAHIDLICGTHIILLTLEDAEWLIKNVIFICGVDCLSHHLFSSMPLLRSSKSFAIHTRTSRLQIKILTIESYIFSFDLFSN
jgi:hypothetical protein